MTPDEGLQRIDGHRLGVLVTLRANGRPQTSNVVYAVRDGRVRVSVTEDRAKTRNLRRDPRATLHVSTDEGSSWTAVEGTAELSAVAASPGDETCLALRDLYVDIAGTEHPDWADFDRAMVEERRLMLAIPVSHAYGGGAG